LRRAFAILVVVFTCRLAAPIKSEAQDKESLRLVQVIPLPNVKGLFLVKTSLHSWNEWFADELDAAYFDKILVI